MYEDRITAPNSSSISAEPEPPPPASITRQEFQLMGETGAAYYEQGNLEKAGMIFAEMINLDPSSAAAHAALGAVLTRIQENDQALELLNRALELNPHELAALVNRGEVWLRRGEHDLALRDLEHAMELDPEKTDPGANRARAMRYGLLRRLGKEVPL